MSFDDDIALRASGDGVYEGDVRQEWWTPRGPLGGYVMALMLNALTQTVADPARMPRSCTMHFLRTPEPGPVTIRTAIERKGRTLSSLSGRLEQQGKLMGLALAAFSTPWEGPLLNDAPMPDVEPPDGRTPTRRRLPDAPPPPFIDRMVFQHRFGPPLFSGADRAEVGGWLGLREERPIDALAVAILADAWFPAPWPRLHALAPAPTIELTIHFRAPLPIDDDGLLLGRFRSRLVRDGFFDEDGELWSAGGTLVAQSRQLGLLIGAQA